MSEFGRSTNLLEPGYRMPTFGASAKTATTNNTIMGNWPTDELNMYERTLLLGRYHRALDLQRAWDQLNICTAIRMIANDIVCRRCTNDTLPVTLPFSEDTRTSICHEILDSIAFCWRTNKLRSRVSVFDVALTHIQGAKSPTPLSLYNRDVEAATLMKAWEDQKLVVTRTSP